MTADSSLPAITLPEDREPDAGLDVLAGAVPGPAWEPVPDRPEPRREPVPELVPGSRHGSREPVPGTAGTAAGTMVPVVAAPVRRVHRAEHLLLSVREWAAGVGASQRRHRSFLHWLCYQICDVQPESLSAHRRYLKSRCWLKDYMTGWLRLFCEWENIAFGITVGRLLKVTGNNISRAGERQSRFWITLAACFLAFAVWRTAHH